MTVKLTFLGTSAQIPSASRNPPGILLTYRGENILIDCGEGTQRQFRKAKLNPGKITKILITHLHGDHVFGLPGFLSTLGSSEYKGPLYIYGPKGTKKFMANLLKLVKFYKDYKIIIGEIDKPGIFLDEKDFYIASEKMNHGIPCNAYCFVKKGLRKIDKRKLEKLKIAPGKHLAKLKQGKNITVNGKKYLAKNLTYMQGDIKVSIVMDTLYNNRIIPFVKNSDLIVCESSFGNELGKQAKERNHLTAKQVGSIAKKSNSKKLILTHISGRYEKDMNVILKQAKKEFKNSFLAKDLGSFEV